MSDFRLAVRSLRATPVVSAVAVLSLALGIGANARLARCESVLAVPGVASAAVSFVTPVSGNTWNNRIDVSGGVELPERQRLSNFNAVTPGCISGVSYRFGGGVERQLAISKSQD
jgi:hypothetical protein